MMRLYTITNMYLSSIQNGIQTAHVVHELFNDYRMILQDDRKMLNEWSNDHKTIIVLNGGYSSNLRDIAFKIAGGHNYPMATFSEEGIDDALTVIGIILPESVYRWFGLDFADDIQDAQMAKEFMKLTPTELKIIETIGHLRLAK